VKTILWNIVPWYIGNEIKIGKANKEDIDEGLKCLIELIKYLKNLKVIVLVGLKSQTKAKVINEMFPNIVLIKCNHPSNQFINRRKENRELLKQQISEVVLHL